MALRLLDPIPVPKKLWLKKSAFLWLSSTTCLFVIAVISLNFNAKMFLDRGLVQTIV